MNKHSPDLIRRNRFCTNCRTHDSATHTTLFSPFASSTVAGATAVAGVLVVKEQTSFTQRRNKRGKNTRESRRYPSPFCGGRNEWFRRLQLLISPQRREAKSQRRERLLFNLADCRPSACLPGWLAACLPACLNDATDYCHLCAAHDRTFRSYRLN